MIVISIQIDQLSNDPSSPMAAKSHGGAQRKVTNTSETLSGQGGKPFSAAPCSQITDTQRLDFLLQFFSVDDVGDEDFVPGVVVDNEAAEEQITYGPADADGRMRSNIKDLQDDMRDIIDRAIIARSENGDMSIKEKKQ